MHRVLTRRSKNNMTCALGLAGRPMVQKTDIEEQQNLKDIIANNGQHKILDIAYSKIVVSCEFISGLSVQEIRALFAALAPHQEKTYIVFYLRNPFDLHRSRVQEMLKKGRTYQDVANSVGHRNEIVFKKFESVFSDRIFVRKFDASIKGWDVLEDFEQACGLPKLGSGELKKENPSLSLQSAVVLDQLAQCGFPMPIFYDLARRAGNISGDRFQVSASTMNACFPDLNRDAQWCNENYGTDFRLTLNIRKEWQEMTHEVLQVPAMKSKLDALKAHGEKLMTRDQ